MPFPEKVSPLQPSPAVTPELGIGNGILAGDRVNSLCSGDYHIPISTIHLHLFSCRDKKEAMSTDTASPKIYLNKEFFIPTRLWQVVLKRCHSILG